MKFFLSLFLLVFSVHTFAKSTYVKKEKTKINSQTCENAYRAAKSSPSRMTVFDADNTCEKAAQAACISKVEKDSDGPTTGDGKWMAASCELSLAYGANKAVNEGIVTTGCVKASKKAYGSPSISNLTQAADICKKEQDATCESIVNRTSDGPNTGDGQLVGASCNLIASHGSFNEVTKKNKTSTETKKLNSSSAVNQ